MLATAKVENRAEESRAFFDAQKFCSRHVLRNAAAAIVGISEMLDRSKVLPPHSRVADLLKMSIEPIEIYIRHLEAGSHCPLESSDCAHMGPVVNCPFHPRRK